MLVWGHDYFFFNDTATTEIYTLSLHDALPISGPKPKRSRGPSSERSARPGRPVTRRSEEHTSELQSRPHLVCRLLLEKKNKNSTYQVQQREPSSTGSHT